MKDITIGIASYNNCQNLVQTIKTIILVFKELNISNYEIIIVDDCSSDNTENELNNIKLSNTKYIRNQYNLGFAKSILKSAQSGTGIYFKILHSGNIESENDLKKYFKNFKDYNLSLSYLKDGRSIFRKFLSKLCAMFIRTISGQNIKYYQSPILCLREDFINLFPKNNGNFFLTEIIFQIVRKYSKNKIQEFMINPIHKKGSTAVSLKNFCSLFIAIKNILNTRIQKK